MIELMDEDLSGWRKAWQWPWEGKERTAAQALIGLGRMHDRLMRKHVWVYQGTEKHKPVLRTIRIIP